MFCRPNGGTGGGRQVSGPNAPWGTVADIPLEQRTGRTLLMSDMTTIEAKAFVPAKDFALSNQFYQDLGFDLV